MNQEELLENSENVHEELSEQMKDEALNSQKGVSTEANSETGENESSQVEESATVLHENETILSDVEETLYVVDDRFAANATITSSPVPTAMATQAPEKSKIENLPLLALFLIGCVIVIIGLIVLIRRLQKKTEKSPKTGKQARFFTNHENETEVADSGWEKASTIECSMAQTVGTRKDQQDSMYCSKWNEPELLRSRGLLAAVSDGIGGLEDGNLASQGAVQVMRDLFQRQSREQSPTDCLLELAAAAQRKVLEINEKNHQCGATLVSVLIREKDMWFLSIGDSHICLYRSGALLQLNREHILGRQNEEMQSFNGGGENLSAKRFGALTSYLGKKDLTLIDRSLHPMRLLSGDRILLMSDGVFNTLSDDELIMLIRSNEKGAAEEIIRAVNAKKKAHQDNASVIVIGVNG